LTVFIRKSGQDESTIAKGIKIKGNKIRVAGAVIRITVIPRKYLNDFKIVVWMPNGKEVEVSDETGYVQWADFAKAMVEAATGEAPKDGTEKKTIDINGFPAKVSEKEDGTTVTIEVNVDPLTEDYLIPKKEEAKPEATTSVSVKVEDASSLPAKVKSEMTDKKTSKQEDDEKIEDWIARMNANQDMGYW
jgi:hypothetical protein